jgi:NDP-hexose 4-ketoreductase
VEIIGNGFLARHLRPLGDVHPDVTVLAAGVPRQELPDSASRREEALVRDTIGHCRRHGRLLVFFSTVSMYGGPGCRGREDDRVVPSTRYGHHKRSLELLIHDSGVDHLALRLGYVLGPHGPDFRLVPALIRQILAGRIRVYPGARRDILYVTEFVTIIDRLLSAKTANQVVNLASGDCAEVDQMIEHLEKRLGVTAEREFAGPSPNHCPSVRKLRALVPETAAMGFAPGYFRTAIDRYLDATRDDFQ